MRLIKKNHELGRSERDGVRGWLPSCHSTRGVASGCWHASQQRGQHVLTHPRQLSKTFSNTPNSSLKHFKLKKKIKQFLLMHLKTFSSQRKQHSLMRKSIRVGLHARVGLRGWVVGAYVCCIQCALGLVGVWVRKSVLQIAPFSTINGNIYCVHFLSYHW